MKRLFLTALILSFFVLVLPAVCLKAGLGILKTAQATEGPKEPIVCNGDKVEYFKEEKKIVGSGNVVITYKDMTLTSDRVTVWTETKEAEAEGNVKLTQGENVYEGERVRYNFQKHTGKIIDAKVKTPPWYAKGKEAERVSEEKFIVRRGYVTTCGHERPHWKLSANKVLVYPQKMVTTYNAIAWLNPLLTPWDIPIMWIPYYCHPLDDDRPHVTIIPGHSSAWGNYLLTAWRYNLTPDQKGYVHLDYRERKDFASGIDYIYDSDVFGEGNITTYYMDERDLNRKHTWDKWTKEYKDGDTPPAPTKEQEKGLLRIRHKWQVAPNTLVTAEMHKYKDESLLKDYFFNEYEKDTRPESYVLATNTAGFCNLSLLAKKRMNRFDEVVERLPEAKLDINNLRLFDSRFYYKGDFSGASLNKVYPRHTDDDPGRITDPEHNNRYDSYNQLSYASKLAFLGVTPYMGIRQTYFDRGESGREFGDESHLRGIFYSGCDISTKFFKVFYTDASPFGMEINNLRHIITPTISYNYIHPATMTRGKVFEFDEIDFIDRKNTVTLGLENKLQTKRGEDRHAADLAMLLVETDYDFKRNPGTQFSDYKAKLELMPFGWLTATSNVIVDPHSRYHHMWLKQADNDITISAGDKWSLGAGHRYTHGNNSMISQGMLNIMPGWRFSVYEDFDFLSPHPDGKKKNDLREQEYVITRDLHCWEMDIRYNVRRDEGEEVMVVFKLKSFPDVPFEFGRSYHRPKFGSQSWQE